MSEGYLAVRHKLRPSRHANGLIYSVSVIGTANESLLDRNRSSIHLTNGCKIRTVIEIVSSEFQVLHANFESESPNLNMAVVFGNFAVDINSPVTLGKQRLDVRPETFSKPD